jgi:hypothetical protein
LFGNGGVISKLLLKNKINGEKMVKAIRKAMPKTNDNNNGGFSQGTQRTQNDNTTQRCCFAQLAWLPSLLLFCFRHHF